MTNKRKTAASQGSAESAQPSGPVLELDSLIGYNLRRAHGVQKQRFANTFGHLGVRPVTLSLLGAIYESPGIRQADLCRQLNIKRANMVPLLTELGERGFITRRPCTSDRRAQRVTLTPAGKKLTASLLEMHKRLEADLVRGLGARDAEQLLRLLIKFRRLAPEPDPNEAD